MERYYYSGMPLPIRRIELRRGDRAKLGRILRSRTAHARRLVDRARIVLGSADGKSGNVLCGEIGVSRPTITMWLDRYEDGGLAAISRDQSRSGRPKRTAPDVGAEIVRRAQEDASPEGTHWTTRLMAKQLGVSKTHVWRVWQAHGIAPHRVDYFKISTDPRFVEELRDVVGLYLDPPQRAVVVSVDEKSQIQALDRTQPGLPLKPGRAGTMTHGSCLVQRGNPPSWTVVMYRLATPVCLDGVVWQGPVGWGVAPYGRASSHHLWWWSLTDQRVTSRVLWD